MTGHLTITSTHLHYGIYQGIQEYTGIHTMEYTGI
jgi:hypothetical protein